MMTLGRNNAAGDWVRVTWARHGTWHWHRARGFAFAHDFRQVPVTLDEIHQCAANMPLVFTPDGMPVAILRMAACGASAFVASGGGWRGSYLPELLRVYPFALDAPAGDDAAPLLLDETSGLVAQGDRAQGVPIFDANGALSAPLANVHTLLQARLRAEARTRCAARELHAAGVLQAFATGTALAGFRGIDDSAMAALGRAQLARLHRSGALALAYAHRTSLQHVPILERAEAAYAAPAPDCSSNLQAFITAVAQDMAQP